jgi:hypothetical protein
VLDSEILVHPYCSLGHVSAFAANIIECSSDDHFQCLLLDILAAISHKYFGTSSLDQSPCLRIFS